MRRWLLIILPAMFFMATWSASAATTRVMKVLPHFLDQQGRHALSPSLYDRDAYQAQMRQNPALRSALRFDVHWKAKATNPPTLRLRAELRGTAQGNLPREVILETEVKTGTLGRWSSLTLGGEEYKNFGEVTAWRVGLWDGDRLVAEQKSFLW